MTAPLVGSIPNLHLDHTIRPMLSNRAQFHSVGRDKTESKKIKSDENNEAKPEASIDAESVKEAKTLMERVDPYLRLARV